MFQDYGLLQGDLSPNSLSKHYSSLCATTITSCSSPKLTPWQCTDLYNKGLTTAANLQQKSVKAAAVKARKTAARELAHWLQTIHAAGNKTLLTIAPEDMLVYLTQHWLPNHAGSATATGELIAAPGSLSGTKSFLAKEFELLGRTGNWNPATQQGNPMHSMQVKNMLTGYANHAAELGYQKKGAVPLTEAEIQTLLGSMLQMHNGITDNTQLLLILRNGLLLSLLWPTCFRGFNAGGVRLDNIVLPTGGSAVPYLVPTMKLSKGAKLHMLPDTTKNKKGGHCSVTLTCDVLCFTTWLQLAVQHYAAAKQPITNYLTRPLHVRNKVFAEKAMTSSNAWARLIKYLKALDMYKGQSVHSTRRGNMIHKQQQLQESNTEIAEAAMCDKKNVKYYTDIHRPTRFKCS